MGNQSSVPTDVLRPQRPPISGQAGLQALQQAERADQYLTLIGQSSINRLARAATNYLPFPHSLKRAIPPADPMEPWPNGQVIWMQSSADDGLPHTRAPNYICIPVTMKDPKLLVSTLLHERVHVSQRLHPEAWRKVLAEAWNMTPWSGVLPADIQNRRRLNPDLLSVPLLLGRGNGSHLDSSNPHRNPNSLTLTQSGGTRRHTHFIVSHHQVGSHSLVLQMAKNTLLKWLLILFKQIHQTTQHTIFSSPDCSLYQHLKFEVI